MTAQPPQIFDRALFRARRTRAAATAHAHGFLFDAVREEMRERLDGIARRFAVGLDWAVGAAIGAEKCAHMIAADPSTAWLKGRSGIVCDADRLPFPDETFDLVLAGLPLHAVDDLPGALVQFRRALKPDGLFIGAAFGGRTLEQLRETFAAAELECEGGVSPRVAPFLDLRDGAHLLQRAMFALPVADTVELTVRYADPLALLGDLRGMGMTNVLAERRRAPMKRRTLQRMGEIYLDRFVEVGRVPATFQIVFLTGWAPHESQQKPLRPGSAKMRLADALKTRERDPDRG